MAETNKPSMSNINLRPTPLHFRRPNGGAPTAVRRFEARRTQKLYQSPRIPVHGRRSLFVSAKACSWATLEHQRRSRNGCRNYFMSSGNVVNWPRLEISSRPHRPLETNSTGCCCSWHRTAALHERRRCCRKFGYWRRSSVKHLRLLRISCRHGRLSNALS